MDIVKKWKITSIAEDVEKLECLCIAGGNIKYCSSCGKVWRFLKRLYIDIPYDTAISPRYISNKTESRDLTDTCTPMFIPALFTIAKR